MIAQVFYRSPWFLVVAVAAIVASGFSAFSNLPRLEDPILRKRVAVISTVFPGANSIGVEAEITIPLEQQLAGVPNIKQIRSTSLANISNIVIELEDNVTEVEDTWARVRQAISQVMSTLPDGCRAPQLDVFPLKAFAAILSITPRSPENRWRDVRRATQDFSNRAKAIRGTEAIELFGDSGEEIRLGVTPIQLAANGVSAVAIATKVQAAIQQVGETDSSKAPLERLSELSIAFGPNQVVLGEFAAIERTQAPATERAIIEGTDAIVIGLMVDDAIRVDQWANRLDALLVQFRSDYANDTNVEMLFSQRDHIAQRMEILRNNLGMSTLAVVLVVFVLMGWQSMIVVASALPLSVLMVLACMHMLSIPIHQMSVTGLIVALGLLIDNAIVIVEEVRKQRFAGMSAIESIRRAIRHLALPLFGSTVTTALAFLPIATLPGPAGEFVGTIAMSVILAVTSSFLLSMTIVPALTGLLKSGANRRNLVNFGLTIGWVERIYLSTLRYAFRHPVEGIVLGLVFPIAGFLLANQLPLQFFPPTDRAQVQIEIERSARDSIQSVAETVDRVRNIVGENPRVLRQSWFLGKSAPTFYYNVVPRRRGTPNYAQAFVDVRDDIPLAEFVRELQRAIDAERFECRAMVRQLEQGPPFDAPIELRLLGDDLDVLTDLGDQVRAILSGTPDVVHTRSDMSDSVPRLRLMVDQDVARRNQLAGADISGFVYTTMSGAAAGTAIVDGERIPIRVRVDFGESPESEVLSALPIPVRPSVANESGPPQPAPTLGSLSRFVLDADVGTIVRRNGKRINEVKGYITAGVLPSIVLGDFKQRLVASGLQLPAGYELQIGGESEKRTHAVGGLIANSVLLFSGMLLILVAVFRTLRSAAIIAAVGGLSIGLGPLSLYLYGFPFGFMAIVGTMGLVGIAINDSIVVLAAIRAIEPAEQKDPDAIARVVFHCTRHILATTLTTIAGFVPLVVGAGEFWPPLAITIAGGVGGATLIALYFVPSLFRISTRS